MRRARTPVSIQFAVCMAKSAAIYSRHMNRNGYRTGSMRSGERVTIHHDLPAKFFFFSVNVHPARSPVLRLPKTTKFSSRAGVCHRNWYPVSGRFFQTAGFPERQIAKMARKRFTRPKASDFANLGGIPAADLITFVFYAEFMKPPCWIRPITELAD